MDLNGSSFNIKLEDLSRTDFFDFVSPLDMNSELNGAIENSSTNINDSHELQSFEQVRKILNPVSAVVKI